MDIDIPGVFFTALLAIIVLSGLIRALRHLGVGSPSIAVGLASLAGLACVVAGLITYSAGTPTYWSGVAAMAVMSQTVVIAVAALVALRQLKTSTDLHRLEALNRIHDDLRATRSLRRRAYSLGGPDELTHDQWDELDDLTTRFDRIAVLLDEGVVVEQALFRSHALAIVRLWHHVQPYVEYQRSGSGRAGHVKAFESMARRAETSLNSDELDSLRAWVAEREEGRNPLAHR